MSNPDELLDDSVSDDAVEQEEEQEQEGVTDPEEEEGQAEETTEEDFKDPFASKTQQQQQKQKTFQDIPGEQLNRQQKRMAERQQAKPAAPTTTAQSRTNGNDKRVRMPQESPVETGMENYSEVENPSSQLLPPGEQPSRAQQLWQIGELQGIGREALVNAASRMQAYRYAFIDWQSQREDYKIFQNVGTDPDTGMDKWEPMTYRLHFLTMGQEEKLRDMVAVLEDHRRARANNDTTVMDVNKKIRKLEKQVTRYKLRTYFRMFISEPDPQTGAIDPDDEYQRASQVDIRDMIDSAEWCFQWVPKSRRIPPSAASGSRKAAARKQAAAAIENEYGIGIQ